jgi:hypothetical protein
MRFAVRVLAGVVGAGAVALALADPSTTAPDTTTAPAAASAPAATATTPGAQASPAPAATATSAATATAKPAIDPEEKRLIAMGYKPEMRNGQKVFCRREQILGSRLAEGKNCATAEQLKISQQETQDVIEKIQRTQKNPTGG